ncbi:MFS transporter [Nannocystaceae bacterium ST9]
MLATDAGSSVPARKSLWSLPFVLAAAANFLHGIGFYCFVHLSGWLEGRGAGELLIGVLFAAMAVSAILSRPLVGRVMDTRGRRIVVLIGGGVHMLATAAFVLLDASTIGGGLPVWLMVAGVRVIQGAAEAMLFSVLFTIAADLVPAERRAHGIALFGISGMLPLAIGGLLGDLVIVGGDYSNLLWIALGSACAGLLITIPLPETLQRSSVAARGFWTSVAAKELRSVFFVGLAFSTGLAAYFTFLKTYLIEAPELGTMGGFFATYALAATILRAFFGWVPERLGLRRVLIPALFSGATGLVVMALASEPEHLILAGLLCGIGHGYAFPILSTLVVMRARPEERGSAISMFTALFDFGLLIGGPMFGAVVMLVDYPGTFAFAAMLVVVATVVFRVWERRLGLSD